MKQPSWHRAKIVCTLGPATDERGVVERMIRAGMDVARINMSHGTEEEHALRIALVRDTARDLRQEVAILADLPGPKFRLGALAHGSRTLEEGSSVILAADARDDAALPVRDPHVLAALRSGQSVYLADGSVELRVTGVEGNAVRCEVAIGGTVRSGSGINVPDGDFSELVPTESDRRRLRFALDHEVEWIGVSFVQGPEDLARVRACLPPDARALLMAKIEKRRALAQLDAVIRAADGVMVARGDLGVETDLAEIALVQKRIIAAANALGRPVVTATQMLESMVEHERPTRAEVTDVANALLDGTDAVMLSAESAIGRHPAAAVAMLDRVLAATESEYAARIAADRLHATCAEPGDELFHAACQLAARLGAKAIVAAVRDIRVPAALARFRPDMPLIMICASRRVASSLVMIRGVVPLFGGDAAEAARPADAAREWLLRCGLAAPGDEVVWVIASSPEAPQPDAIRIAQV